MKNKIITLKEKSNKVFGFSDEQIIISTKNHKTFESLNASAQKSGMLETVKVIQVDSVEKISYNEKIDTFVIYYKKKDKIKKKAVLLLNTSIRETLVLEIANLKGFQKEIVDESKIQPLLVNILFMLMISLFTWGARRMAIDAQNGDSFESTGRRSGLKNLVANGIEAIGPTGITLIGVVILTYTVYSTYKRYKNPASEMKYS